MKKITNLFIILLTLSISHTFADQGQAIQAVSSLLFHVNEIRSPRFVEDPITFENKDIESLWSSAAYLDVKQIEEAKKIYESGTKNLCDLSECAEKLRSIWLYSIDAEFLHNETINTGHHLSTIHRYSLNNSENNPLWTKEVKSEISPYLLPNDALITPVVDSIFNQGRVTYNDASLLQGGFEILFKQPRSYIVVARHPALPGMLFKLYYDTETRIKRKTPGWRWFARRCKGASLIKKVIAQKDIKNFIVPEKYVYVLPPHSAPVKSPKVDPKVAVLIVKDMQLVQMELNLMAWKTMINHEILDELYLIISRANGSSYRPDNIPYTYFGKFAFIDTEYPTCDPDYESMKPYLSDEMRQYWSELVKKGGPKK